MHRKRRKLAAVERMMRRRLAVRRAAALGFFVPALLVILRLAFLSPVFLWAPQARAATYTAATCSAADVQTAVNLTSNGDTVIVPAGSCTWSGANAVTFSDAITIQGAGAGSTIITWGSSGTDPGYNGVLHATATSAGGFVLTGFTFQGAFINGRYPFQIDTSSSTATFHVHHNTFNRTDGGGPGTMIAVNGIGPGLFDHNTFPTTSSADEVVHLLADGAGNSTTWNNDVVPGSANFIFFENNTFTANATTTDTSPVQCYYGARMVFRYNTLNYGWNVDAHAAAPGCRFSDVYENTYVLPSSSGTYAQANVAHLRGGVAYFHNNHESGTPCCSDPTPGMSFGPLFGSSDPQSGAWPIAGQTGRGINQHYSPAYAWGNDPAIQSKIGTANSTYVQIGTSPTDAVSCPGNGGTPSHSAGVCDAVVTTAQPANLIICESAADVAAGCPARPYAVYTYPHPLDTGLTFSPSPVAFGSQNTGSTSSAITVTVTNSGSSSVTTGSSSYFSITGTNGVDFSRSGGGGTPCTTSYTLAPLASCTLQLKFSPAAAGSRSGRLNILGPSGALGSVDLSGTGAAPGGATNKVNAATELKNQVPVVNGGTGLAAVAAHQIPTGTGANTYTAKTVPDCPDVGGNHINFTQSGDSYSCGNSSPGSGPGSGTVTSFSAGNLSPLFTTSVATATSTPALSFSLSNFAAHTFYGNNTGSTGAPGAVSIGEADLPAATVFTDQNATFGAHTYDFTGATMLKARVGAGLTTSANGDHGYDSTNKNWHFYANGLDEIGAFFSSAPTDGNCVKASVSSSVVKLADSGTPCPSGTITTTIASGTSALGTSAISSGACATVVSTSATGTLTTDNIMADFNADPTSTTGYQAGAMLTIVKYPTADHVNFKVCNNTGSSITPGAATLNWRVVR